MAEKSKTKSIKNEAKYTLDELMDHSEKVFGVKPEVVEGALHDKKENEFTKAEADEAIKSFLKRKVQ